MEIITNSGQFKYYINENILKMINSMQKLDSL